MSSYGAGKFLSLSSTDGLSSDRSGIRNEILKVSAE